MLHISLHIDQSDDGQHLPILDTSHSVLLSLQRCSPFCVESPASEDAVQARGSRCVTRGLGLGLGEGFTVRHPWALTDELDGDSWLQQAAESLHSAATSVMSPFQQGESATACGVPRCSGVAHL